MHSFSVISLRRTWPTQLRPLPVQLKLNNDGCDGFGRVGGFRLGERGESGREERRGGKAYPLSAPAGRVSLPLNAGLILTIPRRRRGRRWRPVSRGHHFTPTPMSRAARLRYPPSPFRHPTLSAPTPGYQLSARGNGGLLFTVSAAWRNGERQTDRPELGLFFVF